jgi:hypothetical protein
MELQKKMTLPYRWRTVFNSMPLSLLSGKLKQEQKEEVHKDGTCR